MRVLHSIGTVRSEAGGPSRSIPSLCAGLTACGVDAWLLSHTPGDQLTQPGFAHFLTVKHGGYRASCREMTRLIHETQPAIIHDHGIWIASNHIAASLARKYKIPLIIAPHGMLEPWSLNHHKWKKQWAMWLYQRRDLQSAACLHATAPEEAEQFRRLGFRQPIAVVPNSVDIPAVMPPRRTAANGKKNALFVSRIHPKKGLIELVQAWAKIRPDGWQMLIAGPDEGGYKAVVEAAIQKASLTDVFHFLGQLNDKQKWDAYRQADLFILPTYSENFGIVVAEALAAGVPAITTKGTPWRELESQRCGWWIDIGPQALEKCLANAFSMPASQITEMGERGQRLIAKYMIAITAGAMQGVYEWMLNGGAVPVCMMLN
ncbi:MAG: glycosyltransferase [Victivallaceae bacterium]